MLETRAVVIRTEAGVAWVEARHDASGCGTCQGKGCGSSKLSQMFCSGKQRLFSVSNEVAARPGDEVVIAIREGAVLHGVALVYLIPLFGMLLGGLLGATLAPEAAQRDGYAAAAAFAGLLMGFVLSYRLARHRRQSGRQPYIARHWLGD